MNNKKANKNSSLGHTDGSEQLYTLKDVRELYNQMLEEHYSATLRWLKWVYPFDLANVLGTC